MALLHGGSPVILQFRVREFYGNSGRLNLVAFDKHFQKTEPPEFEFIISILFSGGMKMMNVEKRKTLFSVLVSYSDPQFSEKNMEKEDAHQ